MYVWMHSAEAAFPACPPLQTILEEAYTKTDARGSCTACIAVLLPPSSSDAGSGVARLRVANLGDSGALVLRAGKVVFHSPQQQHGFNFPFQVSHPGSGGWISSGYELTLNTHTQYTAPHTTCVCDVHNTVCSLLACCPAGHQGLACLQLCLPFAYGVTCLPVRVDARADWQR